MRLPVLAALVLLSAAPAAAGPLVFLDAGHGGDKPGAPGPKKRWEKEITLELVKRVKAELEKSGLKVQLTRERDADVGLKERMKKANGANAELFVSVHCNSMPVDSP